MKTVGIILAAGQSKRFGKEDKLLANFRGRPLCTYAAEAMRNCRVDQLIACVSNQELQDAYHGFEIVKCSGLQSDSLRQGVRQAIRVGADRILVALGDMPNISAKVLNMLIEQRNEMAICQTPNAELTAPALFSNNFFEEVLDVGGDQGARKLFTKKRDFTKIQISYIEAFDVDQQEDIIQVLD